MDWRRWGVCAAVVGLWSCTPAPEPAEPATLLRFTESDSAGAATPVRMIVSRKFLRIDGGEQSTEFLLYDRAARTIYNVSDADRLVLVIGPRAMPAGAPPKLAHRTKRGTEALPPVGGRPVVRYRLLTNGRLCYDLYAADGLLPEAVAALREYREALAGEQAAAIGFAPSDVKTPCDLANHVYAPVRHLAHGFPVRLTEIDGRDAKRRRTTELVDYRTDFIAEARLFELPAAYRRMKLGELQKR